MNEYKAPIDGFDYCASCNYLEPVASTIWRDGLDIGEPLCEQCSERFECRHGGPADFGASQVKDGTLVHPCAECGLIMAWSVS